jgi:hypothetical protein
MTNIEGYKILGDSLLQTENTRGDYFINKAKELGIEPANFFTDLKSLYDEMAKRVNSKDYHIWGEDEQGNKEYLYHSINLFHLTNDVRHCILLSRDNIANLVLPGLQQFGELIMRDLKRQETEKHGQLIELLSLNQHTTTGKPPLKGFQSELTDEQIERLYKLLQGSYIDATPANFKAIFKNEPLPPGFIPIKIKKIFSASLCAYFVSELFQEYNPGDYWSIAENCFEAKGLRQLLNNAYQFNKTQKPRGYINIDSILKTIYTPLQ